MTVELVEEAPPRQAIEAEPDIEQARRQGPPDIIAAAEQLMSAHAFSARQHAENAIRRAMSELDMDPDDPASMIEALADVGSEYVIRARIVDSKAWAQAYRTVRAALDDDASARRRLVTHLGEAAPSGAIESGHIAVAVSELLRELAEERAEAEGAALDDEFAASARVM
jgi:hypothetical protein